MENEAVAVDINRQLMLSEMEQPDFVDLLINFGISPIKPTDIGILQINVGKLCNNSCSHCHVEAGPKRTEIMGKGTMEYALKALENPSIHTIDITGGAPEMNPHLEWFINKLADYDKKVIVRTNLSVLLDPKFKKYMGMFKKNQVVLIASMPCYTMENVDEQRGKGVYNKSVEVLKQLNKIGYGIEDTGLELNLVYNPGGIGLAPEDDLEKDYKRELWDRHSIKFNHLYTITNIPIGRFLTYLHDTGQKEEYMKNLIDAFNPEAALEVMCRNTISVSWDGYLYDCDFNQMLDLKIREDQNGKPVLIRDFNAKDLKNRKITFKNHCYGCTAGSGSSCQGALL